MSSLALQCVCEQCRGAQCEAQGPLTMLKPCCSFAAAQSLPMAALRFARRGRQVSRSSCQRAHQHSPGRSCRGRGSVAWYPVHCTSINNTNDLISGDNKGVAAQLFKRWAGSQVQLQSPAHWALGPTRIQRHAWVMHST